MKKESYNFFTRGYVAIVVVALIAVLVVITFVSVTREPNEQTNSQRISESLVSRLQSTPSPTPIPFKELTIPYLRERNYESSLGELQPVSSNASYTSYITSYDSDGLSINGLLTIPTDPEPEGGWPAIVFVHGYIPPSIYQTTENYASYVDYFARRGFVVYKIDLRGHADSDGIASGAYYSGDYVIDTLNAVAALKSSDFVDAERIGLWGHSMAGNVIFRSFVAAKDISALVIWAGAVYTYDDFAEYRIQDTSYRPPDDDSERQRIRDELFETHGGYSPDSEYWQMVVPTNYLDGVTGAVQIHHAIDDTVVSIGYSRGLMEVLDSTTIDHGLFEYSSGGHNITGGSFTQAMQRSVEFYRDIFDSSN